MPRSEGPHSFPDLNLESFDEVPHPLPIQGAIPPEISGANLGAIPIESERAPLTEEGREAKYLTLLWLLTRPFPDKE